MNTQTQTHQIGRDFLTAGHAIFTLANPTTGNRWTYQITRKDAQPGSQYRDPAFFVGLLTGPDNGSDYRYLGMLRPDSGQIVLTRASRVTDETPAVKAIRWAFRWLWAGQELPAPAELHHEGRCGRCGRRLTVPESIITGLGPECAAKMGIPMASRPMAEDQRPALDEDLVGRLGDIALHESRRLAARGDFEGAILAQQESYQF